MDVDYWNKLDQLIRICKPLVDAISNLESRDVTLADCMLELICCARHMASFEVTSDDDLGFVDHARSTFTHEFHDMNTDIHTLTLFLHPRCRKLALSQASKAKTFQQICQTALQIARTWNWDSNQAGRLLEDLQLYHACKAPFAGEQPLKTLAIVLFSVVPHAAEVERLFSGLSGVQGVKRCNLSVPTFKILGKLRTNYSYHIYLQDSAKDDVDIRGIEELTMEEIDGLSTNGMPTWPPNGLRVQLFRWERSPLTLELDRIDNGEVSATFENDMNIHMDGMGDTWDQQHFWKRKALHRVRIVTLKAARYCYDKSRHGAFLQTTINKFLFLKYLLSTCTNLFYLFCRVVYTSFLPVNDMAQDDEEEVVSMGEEFENNDVIPTQPTRSRRPQALRSSRLLLVAATEAEKAAQAHCFMCPRALKKTAAPVQQPSSGSAAVLSSVCWMMEQFLASSGRALAAMEDEKAAQSAGSSAAGSPEPLSVVGPASSAATGKSPCAARTPSTMSLLDPESEGKKEKCTVLVIFAENSGDEHWLPSVI
ncbi:hypothetical protein B0H10DRAFT_1940177 [Mycena sp. CBHHK59/15]|nr:hypothetical protein B0H10DRAFT_1940177 [Mycena sp. CBHHK59/15]